jgi:hypothetical protein
VTGKTHRTHQASFIYQLYPFISSHRFDGSKLELKK